MDEISRVLVIGDKLISEEETTAKLDVFAKEATLGGETDRLKVFGQISVGKHEIVRLTSNPKKSTKTEFDRYLVKLPFTIHQPYQGTEYQEVVFKITMSEPTYIAYDLEPKKVTKSERNNVIYELSPEFKFKDIIEAKLGSISHGIEFEKLYPEITAYGIGESAFYWVYEGKAGEGLTLGSGATGVGISLSVPKGTKQAKGTISYAIDMKYKFMGEFRPRLGKTVDYVFQWRLPP